MSYLQTLKKSFLKFLKEDLEHDIISKKKFDDMTKKTINSKTNKEMIQLKKNYNDDIHN